MVFRKYHHFIKLSEKEFFEKAEILVGRQRPFCFKLVMEDRLHVMERFLEVLPLDTRLVFQSTTYLNSYRTYELGAYDWLNDLAGFSSNHDEIVYYYDGYIVTAYPSDSIDIGDISNCFEVSENGVTKTTNITDTTKTNKKKMEETNMKMNLKTMMEKLMPEELHDEVAFTMNGSIAVKAADGNYYYYDGKQLINTYDMVIPADGMAMLVPTQVLSAGDIIKYNDSFYCITKYSRTEITGINLSSGMVDDIKLTVDLLGMSAFRKVVSIMSMMGGTEAMSDGNACNANPLGMMFMMSLLDDKKGDSDNPMMKMMQMQMMGQMFNAGGMSNNPFFSMFGQPVNESGSKPAVKVDTPKPEDAPVNDGMDPASDNE